MISLDPYLVYNGSCNEAFHFYQNVFVGADLHLTRYKDVLEDARKYFPNAPGESVVHATLQINENTIIMENDHADPSSQLTKSASSGFYLYINTDSPKEAI